MGGGARVCEIPFGSCHAVPLKCKTGAARKDFTASMRARGGGRSGGKNTTSVRSLRTPTCTHLRWLPLQIDRLMPSRDPDSSEAPPQLHQLLLLRCFRDHRLSPPTRLSCCHADLAGKRLSDVTHGSLGGE